MDATCWENATPRLYTLSRQPSRDLSHVNLASQASSPKHAALFADGHIVTADDDAAVVSLGVGFSVGQTEMQAVAGVVCDDKDGALVAGHGLDGRNNLLGARTGKDVALDRSRQHVAADVARARDRNLRR